jgi:hypothetical protein
VLKFSLPEIAGQSHIPENIVWNKIARKYKTRFVNEPLRIYFTGSDQLTKSASLKKNALGLAYANQNVLNTELDYFQFAPIKFLHSAINYSRFSFHTGTSIIDQFK